MEKLFVYGMVFLAAGMVACTGNTAKGGGEAGSDSVVGNVADSVSEGFEFEAVERVGGLQVELPPVPLYLRSNGAGGLEIAQVVYWVGQEKPSSDDAPEYVESWTVQDKMCAQPGSYTKVMGGDGRLYGVKYVGEAKAPDNEFGSLASLQHPQSGLKYQLDDAKAFAKSGGDDYMMGLYWLFPDSYLNSREQLTVKTQAEGTRKPLAADVVKKMEAKFGMQAARSQQTARIGDDYVAGFVQFKPKGEKVLAVEVLLSGDEVWTLEQWGEVDPDEMSVWHVDDGGEYFGNGYDAAFVGPDGPELLYTHFSPESADFGWMTIKGGKLEQHKVGGYYVWYD